MDSYTAAPPVYPAFNMRKYDCLAHQKGQALCSICHDKCLENPVLKSKPNMYFYKRFQWTVFHQGSHHRLVDYKISLKALSQALGGCYFFFEQTATAFHL